MSAKILFNNTQSKLFSQAASIFYDFVAKCPEKTVSIALPGGRSIVPLLHSLREGRGVLSLENWKKVNFFIVDERLVSLDHADSNYRLLNQELFIPLIEGKCILESQVHPFLYRREASDKGVSVYITELKECGGCFHIAALGVGEDSHVGALFPNHHSVKNKEEFFITMSDSPKPPPDRMSSSLRLIQSSKLGFALFLGEGKRGALARYKDPTLSIEQCPAKIIDKIEQGYILTDLSL